MISTHMPQWRVSVPASLATSAFAAAREVCLRLHDPVVLAQALEVSLTQTAFADIMLPREVNIASGYTGLAIAASQFDSCFPDAEWARIGHAHLAVSVREMEKRYLPPGLFSGIAGIGLAAHLLSKSGQRYAKVLLAVDAVLLKRLPKLIDSLHQRARGFETRDYDVISGLTGVGAYLLCRHHNPALFALLPSLLTCLLTMSEEHDGIPNWYIPHPVADRHHRMVYSQGYVNCGLAHGVSGPLALFALAYQQGVRVPGLAEGVARVADWLLAHREDDEWGMNWLPYTPLFPAESEGHSLFRPRTAWCYGAPGIARALWLAGKALQRSIYKDVAIAAMEQVYRKPLEQRRTYSPGFCHGIAGLLHITLHFAQECDLPLFTEAATTLLEDVLAFYQPDMLLGFPTIEDTGNRVDDPGVLYGAAGLALVLLAAATERYPVWDRAFVIS